MALSTLNLLEEQNQALSLGTGFYLMKDIGLKIRETSRLNHAKKTKLLR